MNSYPQKPVVPRPKNVTQGGCRVNRILGYLLLLACAVGLSLKASAASLYEYKTENRTITAESCLPANGYIDPGETNTVSFGPIKNVSGGELTEVKVTILEQGGVTYPSGEVTIGTVAKDATFSVSFTFRANGACAVTLLPTIHVTAKDKTAEDLPFNGFQLGATVKTPYNFANNSPVTINDFDGSDSAKLGRATPYPSSIVVSGVPHETDPTREAVDRVTVTLNNLTHAYSPDVRALLVGPNGKSVMLMAGAGGQTDQTAPINNVTLTFDDSNNDTPRIPFNSPLTSGTFRTADYSGGLALPDAGAANSASLSVFNGQDLNGTWKLYVQDASTGAQGVLSGGWTLSIRTTKISCCSAGQTFPFINPIGEQTVDEDLGGAEKVQIVTFNVSDLDNPDSSGLTVTATSSDQTRLTDSNFIIEAPNGVANTLRVLKINKLVANANGNITVTVNVTDAQGHTSQSPFTLKIRPINDKPTVTEILGQKLTPGTPTGALSFTVGDVETIADNLLINVASSDENVVPKANIIVSGTGPNKTVNIFPASGSTSGKATITLTVVDLGDGTNPAENTPAQFSVDFGAIAGNPTITPFEGVTKNVDEDGSITVPFQVRSGSSSISPDSLIVTVSSGDTGKLPPSGITLGGSGIERNVKLTPAANANGLVSVTLRVQRSDNVNLTDATSFTLNIVPKNDAPTISAIGSQSANEDSTASDINFTVGDIETLAQNLSVELLSSNPALLPPTINPADINATGGFTLVTNGVNRTLKMRPAPNQFGKSTITLWVRDFGDPSGQAGNDAAKSNSVSFVLTVNAVNDPPGITAVGVDTAHLTNWVTNLDPIVDIPEDSGSTADDTKGQRTLKLAGIIPGPPNEGQQSTSVTATSSKPDFVSIVKIDPATVTGVSSTTDMIVKLGENKWTPEDGLVEITLNLNDNGGTEIGGVSSAVRKFKIRLVAVNDVPTLEFPTLPPVIPGQTLREFNAPKNRSFTMPMTVTDVETPKTLFTNTVVVANDTQNVFPPGSILVDPSNSILTFLPTKVPSTLPYTVNVTVTETDNGATNNGDNRQSAALTFKVTIRDIEPPTVTFSPGDIQIDEDTVGSGKIHVADNHPVSTLTYSIKSDNEVLMPKDNVLLGPIDANNDRAVAIVPATDQFGVANVSIVVKDDEGLESQATFKVTVRGISDPPRITLLKSIAGGFDTSGNKTNATITILEDKSTKDDNTDSKLLEMDVADAANETPPDKLVITKASSNTDLVPADDAHITISGTGTRRTITVTPLANKNNRTKDSTKDTPATITLTVTDESGLSATGIFTVSVTPVNDEPTVNQVNNMSILGNSGEITVNLSNVTPGPDVSQSVTNIVVSAKDKGSDPARNTLITITQQPGLPNSDGNTSFRFRPVQALSGVSVLTVTVTDNGDTSNDGKKSKDMSFEVSIAGVNTSPTASWDQTVSTKVLNRAVNADSNTGIIPFYVNDAETPPLQLTLTKSSSNLALVPLENIVFGGSGTTRSVIVTPRAGQGGAVTVTITVNDLDGASDSITLNLSVAAGLNPSISLVPTTQTIAVNGFSDLVRLLISDGQTTDPDLLKVGYQDTGLITSDNPGLVPVSSANIQFGGSGGNRLAIIQPLANQTGTANIGFGVKDPEGHTNFATFTLKVLGSPPTISSVPDQSFSSGETKAVQVTVSDKETFAGFLTVAGKSSDQTVIPDANIISFATSSATKSVIITAGTKSGTAAITLTVTDGEGQTASTTFNAIVSDNNSAPTISPITDQTTTVGKPTGLIAFVVGDKETAPALLEATATSSNTDLVPNSGLLILQSGANAASRSLIVTPAANKKGTSLITVTVKDGGNKTAKTTFTLTVTDLIVANDFNGDGVPDLVLQDNAGYLASWFMSGDTIKSSVFLSPNNVGDTKWKIVDSADFNGDGKPDLLFQHTDGTLAVWNMNGTTLASSGFLSPSGAGAPAWVAVACADFNKDGKPDILFQNTDGTLAVWYMNGTTLLSVAMINPAKPSSTAWRAVAAGDINGDKNVDIVFQHTDGTIGIWYLQNNTNLLLSGLTTPSNQGNADWRVVGSTDQNGDGKTDLLLQNRANNTIAVWYMNGSNLLLGKQIGPSNPAGTWQVVAP